MEFPDSSSPFHLTQGFSVAKDGTHAVGGTAARVFCGSDTGFRVDARERFAQSMVDEMKVSTGGTIGSNNRQMLHDALDQWIDRQLAKTKETAQ